MSEIGAREKERVRRGYRKRHIVRWREIWKTSAIERSRERERDKRDALTLIVMLYQQISKSCGSPERKGGKALSPQCNVTQSNASLMTSL